MRFFNSIFGKQKDKTVFKVGDKVGLERGINDTMVYQIVSINKSIDGTKLTLHCGTYLMANEAVKLPDDSELNV